MEIITQINDAVNGFAWGTFGLALLMGTGLICTLATGFLQFTKIGHWFKNTFGIINDRGRIINDAGALSQRRVFWMWIAALLGMMLKYSENLLGVCYRRRNSEGAWSGGPMYYLKDGLGSIKHCKWLGSGLGVMFCIFTILASFGAGNMAQINKISINIEETFLDGKEVGMFWGASNINWAIGVFLMALMTAILLGGFRRLAAVAEKVMPYVCVAYILGCIFGRAAKEAFFPMKQVWVPRSWYMSQVVTENLFIRAFGKLQKFVWIRSLSAHPQHWSFFAQVLSILKQER